MTQITLITEPSVYLIGSPQFHTARAEEFLNDFYPEAMEDQESPGWKLIHGDERQTEGDRLIEFAGRFCYRSFKKGRNSQEYIENILKEKHGSVLEHSDMKFAIAGISRSLTHELVRHRMMSPSQESQRYVNYKKGANFIVPAIMRSFINDGQHESMKEQLIKDAQSQLDIYLAWLEKFEAIAAEQGYEGTLLKKRAAEAAREFLPNGIETRVVITTNIRALRHILQKRGNPHADTQITQLAVAILEEITMWEATNHRAVLSMQDVRFSEPNDRGDMFVEMDYENV